MNNTKNKFYLLIGMVSIMLIGGVIYADKLIRERYIASSHEKVSRSLSHLNNQLTFNLYNNIQSVKGLPSLFAINPALSQQDFNTAVQRIMDEHTQIRNIAGAPNLIIQYIYPFKKNEAAFGLDYRTIPEQLESVLKAKETHKPTLAGPLELVQGGTGLISRMPVYLKDDYGNEYFWGIIAAVIDVNKLYEVSGLSPPNLDIEVAIRGKDSLGKKGDVFFGNPALFQQNHIASVITLPDGTWQLAARPLGGWTAMPKDIWQQRLYVLLLATTLFILFFAFISALMNSALANLRFKKFLEDTPIPYALSTAKRMYFLNTAFTKLFGYSLKDLATDDDWWLKAYPDTIYREQIKLQWHDYFQKFQSSSEALLPLEANIHCKNGQEKTVLISLSTSSNNDYPIIFYDITERKQAEISAQEIIVDLAFYDPLTHLPNRRLLIDRLTHAVATSERSGNKGALLFLDLDYFKTLNDTLGHDMGDLLLKQVASRLKTCVRECDTIARLGGDEFVILLINLNQDAERAVAEAGMVARKVLTIVNQSYLLGTLEYSGSVSIGSTLFGEKKSTVEELLKQADIAMYQAKKDGRGVFRMFDPHMQAAITTRVALEKELKQAVDAQQFQLYYQVQLDINHQALGAEALIRWNHPERGVTFPHHFISLAEESGVILDIGKWVLNTACNQLKLWQNNPSTKALSLSVNVSAKQFCQNDFVSEVQSIVQLHKIDSTKLKLELTESLLLDNVDATISKMNSLAEMGIRFSLDDFGTGYSSLQYLKQLPLSQLKIDQSFVRDIAEDSSDQAIIRTIIAMAKSLGLHVIAEGVETRQQEQLLRNEGCQQFQGYLYSRPIPIDEFEVLLLELNKR
jgi:diguanylate cyclase (GGDEF)-like protein